MVKNSLVERDIEEGRKIIQLLESNGLNIPVSLWIYYDFLDEWRLTLGVTGQDPEGYKETYRRIQQILNKELPNASIGFYNIGLIDAEGELVRLLRKIVPPSNNLNGIWLKDIVVENNRLLNSFVYRIRKKSNR